jgi:hypothetical protein
MTNMPRKVILSRKGFDSSAGGKPSFIFGNRLITLPIPGNGGSGVSYDQLVFNGLTPLDQVMQEVGIRSYSDCHLDPDLERKTVPLRHPEWKAAFGQADMSEKRLKKHNVGVGDLFLFYGWFRAIHMVNGKYTYIRNAPDLHIIYGYMEVDEVHDLSDSTVLKLDHLASHPHVVYRGSYGKDNRIYAGKKAGVFHFNKSLVLTQDGGTRSCWELPVFFEKENFGGFAEKEQLPNGNVRMKFIGRNNQELLITSTPEVVAWSEELIHTNAIQ